MFPCCLLVLSAVAQTPSSDLDNALAVLDRLDGLTITAEYDRATLTEALADMQTRLPFALRADWPALDRLNVDDGDEITLRLDGVSANNALAAIAFCLGDELERPTFETHAGQVVLTTIEGSAAMRLTAAYDVRDLLANETLVRQLREQRPRQELDGETEPAEKPGDHAGDDSDAVPELPPVQPIREPLGPPPGHEPEHEPLARPPAEQIDVPERQSTPAEELLWLITDHVDPEAWMNYGGNRALISDIDGVLMVTAPPRTHRLLRDALKQLRQANPAMLAVDSMIVDVPRATCERLSRQNDPTTAAFAVALANDKDATIVWRADQTVAIGGELSTQVRSNSIEVQVAIKPRFDADRGLLTLDVDASTSAGDDRRQVKTTIAMNPSQMCATVELAAGQAGDVMRVLVLRVTRR